MAMRPTSTNLIAKFQAIEENCKPQPFLQLAITAKNFISVASLLSDIHDQSEFKKAFDRFVTLLVGFHGAFQQAYDMKLLVDVDESAQSAPRDLRSLDRALATQHRRLECIAVVCRGAEAAACLVGVRRFPNLYSPWCQMFGLLLERPIFASVFQDIDLAKWYRIPAERERLSIRLAESSGFSRIEIGQCISALHNEAGALWVDALIHGVEKDKLDESARRMRRLLNFLTMPTQERWILQEFLSIGSMDSLEAVLKEILRHDLRPILPRDNLDQDAVDQLTVPTLSTWAGVILTEGWLRKRGYLVNMPHVPYFIERLSSTAFENARENPVQFWRTHYRDVSHSMAVRHDQKKLLNIESAITDAHFKDTMQHVAAHLAGDTLAYALSSSVGTSPEASIFIAGCFGIVVDVVMMLRKD
jgi:hypothetical protein